jgi:hypothetical protein
MGDTVCTEAIDAVVENHKDHWRTDSQWTCVSHAGYWLVALEGKVLNFFEAGELAMGDGFKNLWGFMQYMAPLKRRGPNKDSNIFKGQLIKWNDLTIPEGLIIPGIWP